jgi:hypothetical protein
MDDLKVERESFGWFCLVFARLIVGRFGLAGVTGD